MTPTYLGRHKTKGTPYMFNFCPCVPNFTPFALRLVDSQIIEIFCFPIGYSSEIFKKKKKKERKKLKIRNSKFQNTHCNLVRTIGKEIQDKFEQFRLRFVGGIFKSSLPLGQISIFIIKKKQTSVFLLGPLGR